MSETAVAVVGWVLLATPWVVAALYVLVAALGVTL
jgi:hypothetical protein